MNQSGANSRDPRKRRTNRSSSPQVRKENSRNETPTKNSSYSKRKGNNPSSSKKIKDKEREKNDTRTREMNSLLDEDDRSRKINEEEVKSDTLAEKANTKRNFSKMNEKKDFLQFEESKHNDPHSDDEIENLDKTFKKLKGGKPKNEDTSKGDGSNSRFEEEKKEAPWMSKQTFKIRNTLVRFHNEIIDFMNHVSPTKEEHAKREKAFER
jgi:hypothetical protein